MAKQFELPSNTEVSIALVDNIRIQELNREYRGIDTPTDVLSFAFNEGQMAGDILFTNGSDKHILGDIIISLECAFSQAEEYGHSFKRELGFLTVHGMLHLLGYDHQTPDERVEMERLQEEILAVVDLSRKQ